MNEENAVKETAEDMLEAIKGTIEGKTDQIMDDIKDSLGDVADKWQNKAKSFITSRFTNLLSIVTSRKNIIAVLAILFIGPAHYKAIFALAALAMVLNTVEKCAYVIKKPKETDAVDTAVEKALDKK